LARDLGVTEKQLRERLSRGAKFDFAAPVTRCDMGLLADSNPKGGSHMEIKWSAFHRLTEENVSKYVPTTAGVYLLWVKLKSEKWRCYYVGQSKDLDERLLAHLSPSEPNECIKDNVDNYASGFEYARVGKQKDRDGIEKFLYDHYSPECNEKDPGGTPIPVNLP